MTSPRILRFLLSQNMFGLEELPESVNHSHLNAKGQVGRSKLSSLTGIAGCNLQRVDRPRRAEETFASIRIVGERLQVVVDRKSRKDSQKRKIKGSLNQ
jgi:hypothetical protein